MAHSRAFYAALGFSTLFHLSMISVFSIVIYFPHSGLRYCEVEIVHPAHALNAAEALAALAPLDTLQKNEPGSRLPATGSLLFPTLDSAFNAQPDTEELAALPPIKLPRIELAALDGLRLPEENLRIRSDFEGVYDNASLDSWARFSKSLQGIGPTLWRWTFARGETDEEDRGMRVGNPAPGFDLTIQWMSAPQDRRLLFSPPIQALWKADPGRLEAPIAVVFTVTPEGRVKDIQKPVEDEAGIVADVGRALLQFRFEPLPIEETRDQRGTLVVAASRAAE